MPKAFGYARVSSRGSAESGLSEATQRQKIADYYEKYLKPNGVAWGETVFDAAVSGGSKDFLRRPSGQRIDAELGMGDVIIVSKIDRAFRNLRDCLNTTHNWEARGIRVVFVDIMGSDLDLTTIQGKAVLFALGFAAEVEWMRGSERHKEKAAAQRARGRPVNQKAPHGFRIGAAGSQKILYPDPLYRRDISVMVGWRQSGLQFLQIKAHLDKHKVTHPLTGRLWHYDQIKKAVHAEVRLRKIEAAAGVDGRLRFVTFDNVILEFAKFPSPIRDRLTREFAELDGKTGVDTEKDSA